MTSASVGFQCPECIRAGRASVPAPRGTPPVRAAGRQWGVVTLTLIAVNVAMFVATAVSAYADGERPLDNHRSSLFLDLQLAPALVQEGGEDWRLLTAAFLHIGITHLALNMLALLLFGSELERALGRWRYLAVYLLSALGGSVAVSLFGDPWVPVAGASGAIWGLMGAFGVLAVTSRGDVRGIVTLLVLNLAVSILVPGISLLGHLGGLVVGVVAAGIVVLARRRTEWQGLCLLLLTAVLCVTALTVPTLAVLDF
ncbi:rhomboid family intramembrane serine protease [Trujillonella endophytica]|nr:rhomboid family intramembrane serine protease [Trujillella endophytica]